MSSLLSLLRRGAVSSSSFSSLNGNLNRFALMSGRRGRRLLCSRFASTSGDRGAVIATPRIGFSPFAPSAAVAAAAFLGCGLACGDDNSTAFSESLFGMGPAPPQMESWSNVPLRKKHKVALCEWPADQCKHNGDARTASIDALFTWVKENDYDGVEMSCGYFASKFFPNMPHEDVAKKVKATAEQYGLEVFGCNVWWCFDYGKDKMDWTAQLEEMREQIKLTKMMGGGYVTFQMWLPPRYLNTGGSYRRDEEYLGLVARRIEDLCAACWEQGMNCYIETHVDRVTEDPEGFNKIAGKCRVPLEVNGDLSHYIYRAFRPDAPDVAAILERVNHLHVRMARKHGDLSANVKKPKKDWKKRGLTWQAFEFTKPGLSGGLSSRVICGESGPMHDVADPLSLDAKLVPLYRLMAAYADASVKGEVPEIDAPGDIRNPFKTGGKLKLSKEKKKEEKRKKKKEKKEKKKEEKPKS